MVDVKEEIRKLNISIEKVSEHLDGMREIALEEFGESNAEIFEMQKMLLNDTGFYSSICSEIENGASASAAVEFVATKIKEDFLSTDSEVFRAKATDIVDIAKRLVNVIEGHALAFRTEDSTLSGIVNGDEMTTSDIMMLNPEKVSMIVFEATSQFSHRVILAKARGLNISFGTESTSILTEIATLSGLETKKFLRTEFILMNRKSVLDIDEQISIYSEYIVANKDEMPVIRLFDIGGDKESTLFKEDAKELVSIPKRGIRRALDNKSILKIQIKAIILAAVNNQVKTGILIPMVSTKEEILAVTSIVNEIGKDIFENQGKENLESYIAIGSMIETPSAAIISDKLAKVCDFMMVGVNDLLQFTYACDRNSKDLEKLYKEEKDAILRLTSIARDNAIKENVLIYMCDSVN